MDTKEARGLCAMQHKISLIDRCFSLLFEHVDMLLMCLSMRYFFVFKPEMMRSCKVLIKICLVSWVCGYFVPRSDRSTQRPDRSTV